MKATTLRRSGILKEGGGRYGNHDTCSYRTMGIAEIWVIDPQDSTFYRYENLQLARDDAFSHGEKGIVFDMNQLKTLLY
jgi:hypothetical protein